jgi:hypothetical protein
MRIKHWLGGAAIGATLMVLGYGQTIDEALVPIDHPAIRYNENLVNDRVTRVIQDMKSGTTKLTAGGDATGTLERLLQVVGVNADSQVMVFSKTSFQASRISPRNPRAIYFSDDVMVGYVRGSDLLEVAALDPKQGFIFYSFDRGAKPPRFDRRDVCLQCHESKGTLGVPGILIASVYPDADGMPAFRGAANLTDHRSRFEDRWGGWYVTGTHGGMHHLGNAVGHEPDHPEVLDTRGALNLTSLLKKFDPAGYLSPTSDIVALMTLEHQTRMSDLIIRVGWEARVLQHDGNHDGNSDQQAHARFDADLEALVTYMLFADEAPLEDEVQGVSTFTRTFPERGPRDRQGRSLRDFDLKKRLFKYPLSYMVYSEAFDSLPGEVRERIYQRVFEVLTGKDQSEKFKRLSRDDRQGILEILRDTKTGLPSYWGALDQRAENK